LKTLVYVAGQTAGWFACIVGAAQHRHWLGLLVVTGLVVLHVVTRGNRPTRRILVLVLASILFGFCFDSLLISCGVYEPVRWVMPFPFAPIWLVALWVNFALIVDVPLRWLQNHLLPAAAFGGIFGPAAYLAGQQFGAVRVAEPVTVQVGVLCVAWALGLPTLMLIARALPSFGPGQREPMPA
jgi:hypothetical protein